MQSDIVVIPAERADLTVLVSRNPDCFPHDSDRWDEEIFSHQLPDDGHVFLILKENGVSLGYICMSFIMDEAELNQIAVFPEAQGRGFAQLLFDSARAAVSERGAETIYLEVRESNAPARGLYKKLGFLTVGKRKNYYKNEREDAILMKLALIAEGEKEGAEP